MALAALQSVEAAWVWFYTAGMERTEATRRRQEIHSAQWEFGELVARTTPGPWVALTRAAHQFVAGIPADVSWRFTCGRSTLSVAGAPELGAALLLLAAFAVAMPAALLFVLFGPTGEAADATTTEALTAYVVIVTLAICGGGLVAYGRFPVAGSVAVAAGSLCIALSMWWMPHLMALAVAGMVAAVVAAVRSARARSGEPLDN